MHRSHTSLLSQCLYNAGLHLGDNLLDANQYNPHGHFEHNDVVSFHEKLIEEYDLRSRWLGIRTSPLEKIVFDTSEQEVVKTILYQLSVNSKTYGWKDPRACLFLSEWNRIVPKAKFLFIVRHPAHCVQSLMRRSYDKRRWKSGPMLSLALFNLWQSYNANILTFLKGNKEKSALINAKDFQNPQLLNRKLNQQLIGNWKLQLKTIDVSQNYNPELVTSKTPSWSVNLGYKLKKEIQETYEELLQLAL